MRAIDRKALRDLWWMKGQAVAIALVVAAGVATYVSMTSVVDTLERTLERYYREHRFADLFALVIRAPEPVAVALAEIPGVAEVETRVNVIVNLEIPAFDDPVSGLLISLPEEAKTGLSRVYLRRGRFPAPEEDEVVLNEVFAEAHDLGPGDELVAIVAGRARSLAVVGVGLSPEFLMQVEPGTFFPDPERYGVMWMGRARLAALADMEGAFNDVSVLLAPGATEEAVLDAIDRVLAPYGGEGAFPRADQPSHFLISQELDQLRGMAALLPTIFLLVAAFLLNVVVSRVVALEREVIAVLKAFGYRNLEVGLHYLKLVLFIALPGAAAGTLLGLWFGRLLGEVLVEYFRFPYLDHAIRWQVVLTAVGMTAGASVAGAFQAVRRAVRLVPADAMRPPAPAVYRAAFFERIGLDRLFDQPTRMILRHLEREPVKSFLSSLGVASACAILVMGLFWTDAIDAVVEAEFGLAQRDDFTVTFLEPTSTAAIGELRGLPGVRYAEPFRHVPVRLRSESRRHDLSIEGIPDGAILRRVLDEELRPIPIPPRGLLLSQRLADLLEVAPGDEILVEVREGRRETRRVPVVGVARQFLGLGAYMEMEEAVRLAGAGQSVSGALLSIDRGQQAALVRELRDRPQVLSVVAKERAIESYLESAGDVLLIFTFVLSLFAGVIAFGVIYSSARISLAERGRELATLRVLGFTRGEIAYILLGELTLITLLAIPIGLVIGAAASTWAAAALETELYEFPAILTPATFATAALVVVIAAVISALIVARRLWRLDLIAVLKTRE